MPNRPTFRERVQKLRYTSPKYFYAPILFVIDEVIEKVKDGSVVNFIYDSRLGKIVEDKKL